MKNLKFLFALCLLTAANQVRAGWADGYAILNIAGSTNFVAAGSAGVAATNYFTNALMVANRSENLLLAVNYNFLTAPVGVAPTVIFRIQRSLDGAKWESLASTDPNAAGATCFHTLTVAGRTNDMVTITNIAMTGVPYLRIYAIENTNSAPLTNLNIYYGVKR